jgi:hypothetical protein
MNNNNKKVVFLGGTCNGSTWREELIPQLKIDSFDPVVPNWTPECQAEEVRQREICDYCLYVLTPKMTGVFAVAEVVDDSNKHPEKTILVVLTKDGNKEFEGHQIKALNKVIDMVIVNGGKGFKTLSEVAAYLNS